MRWATRPRIHVDRAACAWLIRRFVDPAAELGAPGLDIVIRGLTLTSTSDHETIAITDRLFDGLYELTRRHLMTGRPPA